MAVYRHLIVPLKGTRTKFRPVNAGGQPPPRDRGVHGRLIARELEAATVHALGWLKSRQWNTLAMGPSGFYLEIAATKCDPAFFESKSHGIEVVSAIPHPEQPGRMLVTVFVPEAAKRFFQDKIDDYLDSAKDTKDGPRYADRINRIEAVSFRDPLELLWTDPTQLLPEPGVLAWWEVWVREDRDDAFKYLTRKFEIARADSVLRFPERVVRFVRTTREQLERIVLLTGSVAELRRAKDTPSAVLRSSARGQIALSDQVLARIVGPPQNAPTVCLLDTGLNADHPLLACATSDRLWTHLPQWGVHDGAIHGHGTQMAGISLFGDLTPLIMGNSPITITHRIESVKIVPDDNEEPPDIQSYGHIYKQAVSRPEIDYPNDFRIFCSAITNDAACDKGMPTSWSGALDEICAYKEQRRLFVISAGNVDNGAVLYADDYPSLNETTMLFDPAQAWDALTVGAFTERDAISDAQFKGYEPLAQMGDLCPQSRTSMWWDQQWPAKPDVVLEGGNFAREPGAQHAHALDDLMLLTTNSDYNTAPFATFGFTSGAAAEAARMCATIAADYPDLWPETIRALMAHSAEYTPAMLGYYDKHDATKQRAFLSRFGHGVPQLERALRSVSNDTTMIIEGTIQPFVIRDSRVQSNDIIYYTLPWPTDVLLDNYDVNTYLRITLSYYIEPNPARRGFTGRYQYASHGLRFAVRRPNEEISVFRQRVNDLERSDDYSAVGSDPGWFLHHDLRHRGCLISDTWEGPAAKLAERNIIAVYPIGGWWKHLKGKRQAENHARFSLCVSLKIDDPAIDLYIPIQLQLPQVIELDGGHDHSIWGADAMGTLHSTFERDFTRHRNA